MPTRVARRDPLSSSVHQRLIRRVTDLFESTSPTDRWETYPGSNVRLWKDHIRCPDVAVATVDLHLGVEELTASACELVDGVYEEIATAPDGVLGLERPWPLEADLWAMARGRGV
ncbi:hypothetical protein WEH80_24605 [Actinomycetes bacterium KLBMP 9759]